EGREVQNGTSDGETQPTMMKAQTVDEGHGSKVAELGVQRVMPYNTNNFFGKTREQCHETCDSPEALDVHGNSLPDAMFTNNDDPTLTCCICFNRYVVKTTTCDDDCNYYGHLIKKSEQVEIFEATCRAMCEQVEEMGASAASGPRQSDGPFHIVLLALLIVMHT
ncbi:hypothetical protein FOZ62_008828, partial [Perkinsus olseni]